MKCICKTKCFHEGKLYKEGDTEDFEVDSIPKHFVPVTERALPTIEQSAEENNRKEEIQKIQEEMDKLGLPYDRRWGADRLRNELINGKRGI